MFNSQECEQFHPGGYSPENHLKLMKAENHHKTKRNIMEHDLPNLHFWVWALSLLGFLLPNLITVRRISPAASAPSIIGELDANHSFVGYHIGPHPFHAMMPWFSFPFLKLLAPSLLLWSWSFLSNCFCIWFNDLVKLDQSHGLGGGSATEGGEESLDPCCFMNFLPLQMCELKVSINALIATSYPPWK